MTIKAPSLKKNTAVTLFALAAAFINVQAAELPTLREEQAPLPTQSENTKNLDSIWNWDFKPESRLPKKHLIFTGSANPELGQKIAKELNTKLSALKTQRFPDGEISIQFGTPIRGKRIYIVTPICRSNNGSVNDHLMELRLAIDAATRASVKEITAVVPYFGYARQDRKTAPSVPISASVVASMIEDAGANRVLCVDLHCGQIQGFFKKIPVDNLYASLIFAPHIKELNLENIVIVSPDAGGVERAKKFARFLTDSNVKVEPNAMISKERNSENTIDVMNLVGNVKGKNAIIVDDIIDSGGTLVKAGELLIEKGAIAVYACVTHPVFSGNALEKIEKSPFKLVLVTDTIPLRDPAPANLKVVSSAPLIANAIEQIAKEGSVSDLFKTTAK